MIDPMVTLKSEAPSAEVRGIFTASAKTAEAYPTTFLQGLEGYPVAFILALPGGAFCDGG